MCSEHHILHNAVVVVRCRVLLNLFGQLLCGKENIDLENFKLRGILLG